MTCAMRPSSTSRHASSAAGRERVRCPRCGVVTADAVGQVDVRVVCQQNAGPLGQKRFDRFVAAWCTEGLDHGSCMLERPCVDLIDAHGDGHLGRVVFASGLTPHLHERT